MSNSVALVRRQVCAANGECYYRRAPMAPGHPVSDALKGGEARCAWAEIAHSCGPISSRCFKDELMAAARVPTTAPAAPQLTQPMAMLNAEPAGTCALPSLARGLCGQVSTRTYPPTPPLSSRDPERDRSRFSAPASPENVHIEQEESVSDAAHTGYDPSCTGYDAPCRRLICPVT